SLGYLSEVERGQKEASSELLESISKALNVPLSHVLRLVADRMDIAQGRPTPAMRRAAMREQLRDRMADRERLSAAGHSRVIEIPDSIPESLIERELAGIRR
ncbi:MAG: hypothetical protein MR006_06655, partial [Arcanobacterium sp.]|nr:hypothetical protein [Arcanobacterium sp.]